MKKLRNTEHLKQNVRAAHESVLSWFLVGYIGGQVANNFTTVRLAATFNRLEIAVSSDYS